MPKAERKLLTNRKQDISVYLLPDGKQFQVEAKMQDEIHHMLVRMTVDNHPLLKIRQIEFEMPGVPDPICTEAVKLADALVGQNAMSGLNYGSKDEKNKTCFLLKNLFRTACTVLLLGVSYVSEEELNAMFPGITEEQRFKIYTLIRPDMKNSCLRYADDSPFMQRVNEATWVEGVDKLLAQIKN